MNFYEILNVSINATEKDIKKAYRILAKKYHPDTYSGNKEFAETKMQEINVAYDTLSNSNSRKEYDAKLGINVRTAEENPVKETYYSKSSYTNSYTNPYNKSGVNYEVRYRPNNRKIKYDSNGYAESNYYTSENNKNWREGSDFSLKNIKKVFGGKRLKYTLGISLLVGFVLFAVIYQAVSSMNEFFETTTGVYNKINSAKMESEQIKQNTSINLGEEILPVIKDTVNNVKNEGKELLDKYKQEKENKSKKETLNEWGITNEEDQQAILDFLEQVNKNN